MRTLIIYGTNATGTLEAAELIRAALLRAGHEVTLVSARDAVPGEIKKADLIIFGSCTWYRIEKHAEKKEGEFLDGQLQEEMHALLERLHRSQVAGKRCAVFALGDDRYSKFCAAADHLEKFVQDHEARKVEPTLRLNRFFFDLPHNRQIVTAWADHLARTVA